MQSCRQFFFQTLRETLQKHYQDKPELRQADVDDSNIYIYHTCTKTYDLMAWIQDFNMAGAKAAREGP